MHICFQTYYFSCTITMHKKRLAPVLLTCCLAIQLHAQSFYFSDNISATESEIWLMDIGTCSTSPLITGLPGPISDFVEVPGGFLILQSPSSSLNNFYFYDTATGTNTLLTTLTTYPNFNRLLLLNNTEVLWADKGSFYIYNFITNQITTLFAGPDFWPHSLFQQNGQIYYVETTMSLMDNKMYTINLTPTFSKTLVTTLSSNPEQYTLTDMSNACDQVFYMYQETAFNFSLNNYTYGPVCEVPFVESLYRTAPLLDPTSGPRCSCTTDAGTWNWNILDPQNYYIDVCGAGSIVLPHNNDETLDPGQHLSFALCPIFSAAPLELLHPDSIVTIYSSPTLQFIPGVTQINTFYYLVPVASASPPGTINLSDPCFDIQFPLVVRWRQPVVQFTTSNPNECGNGCRSVQADFEGEPPFQLTYQVTFSPGGTQTFTQTFPNYTGTIQVCPPSGMNMGTINIQATSLTDQSGCSCN